jgi:hypothetical protein
MLRLTHDANLVNAFANDPAIRPHIGAPVEEGEVDLSAIVARGDVRIVHDGDAMMLFQHTGPAFLGIWEKHTMFRLGCRGRAAIEMGRAMFAWAAAELGAVIWSQTPVVNVRARWFNRQIGMLSRGVAQSEHFGAVEHFEWRAACL